MQAASAEAFPGFFEAAPRIRVRDALADFLGAARDGVLEYRYADAVRLAGHSCPTVASAFLMARAALAALFPERLPERGEVRVELRDPADEGVTGVIANVLSLVTGATVDTGFKGLGGRFDRRQLLAYEVAIEGQVRFTRTDNGDAVTVRARVDRVPADPRAAQLMPRCVLGVASAEEQALFREIWQERVRKLLVESADDPEVIVVTRG
jgi:formylmethanofuran dehydrogenase subunit E